MGNLWTCYFLFVCSCLNVCPVTPSLSDSLQPHGLQPTRLLCPWDFPGKNIRVGCHFLLWRIFPTQILNSHLLCLLHWQASPSPLAAPGKPLSLCTTMETLEAAAAAATSLQSCPTLCDPLDSSLLGSSVQGILQARLVEWVAMPSSRGSS